jgi:hypothetical protein
MGTGHAGLVEPLIRITHVRIESVSVFLFRRCLCCRAPSCSLRRKDRERPGHGGGGPSTRRLAKPSAQWRLYPQLHSYGSVERSWDYQPWGALDLNAGL